METQFHDFLKSDRVLDYLQAHPDGPKVLNALRMLGHGLRHGDPRLVHIDSHPGNILWKGERISVVIDWGETTHGDLGIEVAYLYTQPATQCLQELAMKFQMAYEREFGRGVENLEFRVLAAAVRFMPHPAAFFLVWQLPGIVKCSEVFIRCGLAQLIASIIRRVGIKRRRPHGSLNYGNRTCVLCIFMLVSAC